jgi:tetratricopeptide (TPR) repeat protein
MDTHLQRALVLLEQSRYELAEKELRLALTGDPDDPIAHGFLALCLNDRDDYAGATEEAEAAVRLAPDWSEAHAIRARVLANGNRLDEAERAVEEALRLDPEDADHHALLASVRLGQKEWAGALEAAERGLALDAEHVRCNNYRAMALTKLGRSDEAGATMEAALARDPADAFSHANVGWNYLHQRQPKKALEHFREALRLNPTLDYARAGMVEALKSKNLLYALMLRYFLWMSTLGPRAQWAVVLGGYLGFRFLSSLAQEKPAWVPWIRPLLVAYFVFAILTWIAAPVFNLLLKLDRFGRHALSRDQSLAATWVGVLLALALGAVFAWLVLDVDLALLPAVYFGFLLLPVSAIFNCDRGWPRRWMIVYTVSLAALFPAFLVLIPVDPFLASLALQGFIWGSVLSSFVANLLIMARVRH